MIDILNKTIKVTKLADTKFDGNHPGNQYIGKEHIGKPYLELKVGQQLMMQTDGKMGSYFKTSCVTKINDDMTFNTHNSLYKIEIINE